MDTLSEEVGMFSRFALAMFGPFSTVTIAKTSIAHKKRAIEHADSIARERSRIAANYLATTVRSSIL